MLLWMQKYDFVIEYKPRKDLILTVHLSCFPSCWGNLPWCCTAKSSTCIVILQVECDLRSSIVKPEAQHSVLPYYKWMAQLHCPGPQDCQTLLGHPGWAVHWRWLTNQRWSHLYSPQAVWPYTARPQWRPPRNQEDGTPHPSLSVLAQHQCWHCQLCLEMNHLHPAQDN